MDWIAWTILILVVIALSGIRIVQQYEQGVVFRVGRVQPNVRRAGIRWIIPLGIDRMRKVNLRIVTMPVQSQKIITKDNVSMDVSAVAYYKISDAIKSLVEIENVVMAVNQRAQITVRNIVGQSALDDVLSETDKINAAIKKILDDTTEQWGVAVTIVELKDIQLPDTMQRAMAKQAEAEREKRAKIIAAEGEALSVIKLAEAADVIASHPIALQLRNLQVLTEIAVEKNSTIIFPNQFMDTVDSVQRFMKQETKQ